MKIVRGTAQAGEGCFLCGHCAAICPAGAVKLEGGGVTMDGVEPVGEGFGISPDAMLHAIKTRRSVRRFTKDPVDRQTIEKIIEAGRFSPTANNAQNVSYIVVGSDSIDEFTALAMSELRKLYEDPEAAEEVFPKALFAKRIHYEEDDFLFKGGRALIFTVSPNIINASIASADMELMAEAEGLGVVYIGIFIRLLAKNAVLREYLGMAEGDTACTCLSIGRPNVKYQRSAPRKEAIVRWL
jgi:nitroreductase